MSAETEQAQVELLFRPFSLKSLNVANRLVMAPMGRMGSTEGVLAPTYVDYYARRARGGTGTIIGEATAVADPVADGYVTASRFHGDGPLEAWARVVAGVHAAGGAFVPQLWHSGAARFPDAPHPDRASRSPSGHNIVSQDGGYTPARIGEPMTEQDIEEVIAAHVASALAAQRLGCDAIEIHGAHGYLIDQFFWTATNSRADRYGRSGADRTRFAVELLKAVRAAVGPDYAIMLRLSQWKMQDFGARLCETPQELEELVCPLVDAGADIIHCSQRRYWEPEFAGSDRNLAGWVKRLSSAATITVGSVGLDVDFMSGPRKLDAGDVQSVGHAAIDRLLAMMARGDFDLVALGRALLANPEWPHIVRSGELDRLRPYTREALARIE